MVVLPGGDLVEVGDDFTGDPGHGNGALDVLGLLPQVGARNGEDGAPLNQPREWLNLDDKTQHPRLFQHHLINHL